jgi:NAD(P)-dependent dehydrogenase (short-subunit alcohol dehydrogenase family)
VTQIAIAVVRGLRLPRECAGVTLITTCQPDDIKGLALFLAAPASEYITGQEIIIDGGWGLVVAD